jgi:hypothetical protein
MHLRSIIIVFAVMVSARAFAAEEFELPPEVTPALRAACEQDVRRLCVRDNPTVAKVRNCVEQKFSQLGTRCKVAIASAGLAPGQN